MGQSVSLKFKKRNNFVIFILLFSISTFLILEIFSKTLFDIIITDRSGQKIFFKEQINSGDRFSISYIHSVEKTPVIEIFEINKNYQIVLKETHTVSTGAGLPSQVFNQEVFIHEDNKFKIKNINRILSFIPFTISQSAKDMFYFLDTEIDLSSVIGNSIVYIKIIKESNK